VNTCQLLLVCLLWGAVDNPQAAETQTEASLPSEVLTAPNWEIAPEISWFQYKEPGTMKNSGWLYGAAVSHTWYKPRQFFRLEGEVCAGTVEYEGSLMDGTPYTMDDNRDTLVNLRALWGDLWQTEGCEDQFYAGFAYRFLNDDSTQDPAGYQRYSNYFYLPIGLRTHHDLAGNWQLGFGGEFDLLLVGVQISEIDTGDTSSVTNVQWPGFGGRLSAELRHRSRSVDLALAPFVQYWWVDESSVTDDGWYEPRNNTLQAGLSVIWRF
jgi:hypothetical protein